MLDTTDTIQASQAAADTVQAAAYYAPAFPDGLTDTVTTSAKARQLQEYPIITTPQGMQPEEYQMMPVHSSGVLLMLIVSFLLVAFCYRTGRK